MDYDQILNASDIMIAFMASAYQGDEVGLQEKFFDGVGRRLQRLFRHEDRVYQPDELPVEITDAGSYVNRLYLFNKVINEVMESQGGTEEQKSNILAQARVGRALCNLMFLNDFSLPYDPATASQLLGIPLITAADVTQRKFERVTIQESYDFVIRDLTEAIPDLGPVKHRRKFSKAAAEFFLGRVYLYMGQFEDARKHIDNVFAELDKANIALALYDYNDVLAPGGEWGADMDFGFGPSNKPLDANNTEILYNVVVNTFHYASANAVVISPETAALYNESDKRLALYSDTELFGSYIFPKGMRRYPGFSSNAGPSVPDLYLMRAELKARAGDLNGAASDVEYLRAKRMSDDIEVPANIASDQNALVKFILDERIREFPLTGLRWLDMRRLSVDPIFKHTLTYKHNIYNEEGNVVHTYTLRPERFALKFGERMLSENDGLVENQ